jgi:glucan phosphoethanolaminetransferase (alkaline phosphatase superfamily)
MYYYVLNFGVLALFIGFTVLILYYCNKNKLSDYEKGQKMLRDQQYILSKIRYYKENQHQKQQSNYSPITNLPFIEEK